MLTSAESRNQALAAMLTPDLNSGYIRVYAGEVPAHPESSRLGNTLLVQGALNATAFGTPSNGSVAANAVEDVNPTAGGTAAFVDLCLSDGTVRHQLSIGTSGTDVIVGTTTVVIGIPYHFNSITLSIPESSA